MVPALPPSSRRPRLLVVGCGGIGGNLAGGLSQLPPDRVTEVVALSTNWEIARAVAEHGYRLTGVGGAHVVPGRVVTALEPDGPRYDWILLATQPPQVEAAAAEVAPWLAEGGAMVCLQNGLCEERVARVVGRERVVGAIVAWGASMHEPGVYERTSAGGFVLGTLPGVQNPHLPELASLLQIIGPTVITDNLSGARWSKLAFNCAISTLGTIGGDRVGPLMRRRFVRRLALEIMSEVVDVARAEGVRLERLSGTLSLDWLAITPEERRSTGSLGLFFKHTVLYFAGLRYRRLRSSMLAAVERGRTPAVDFLNGEIVERGRRHGVATPANAAAQAAVHAIADGARRPSVAALRTLNAELGLRG